MQILSSAKTKIDPFLLMIRNNSIESEMIVNLYSLLVELNYKREGQTLLYDYLDLYYNDQHAITLLDKTLRIKHEERTLAKWVSLGKPVPVPHIVKQNLVKKYSESFNVKIFVETGTLFGDMIEAMKNNFEQLYSIELSKELYERASKRFANDRNVKFLNGDSGKEIKHVIKMINQPALFFLDGHYSGGFTAKGDTDTPIFEELEYILKSNYDHILVIDDARLFGTDPAYPSINDTIDFVVKRKPHLKIFVENDSIIVTP